MCPLGRHVPDVHMASVVGPNLVVVLVMDYLALASCLLFMVIAGGGAGVE